MVEQEEPSKWIGQDIAGRYTLRRLLGAGGMGAVYAAWDEEGGLEVALKILAPDAQPELLDPLIKRMKREVKVLSAIDDARVIRLLDWGQDQVIGWYYAMELLEQSCTLKEHIQNVKPSLKERLRLLHEILLGLEVVHQHRVIHRDLKPSNVLCVQQEGKTQIKLIDLGIARWFSDELRTHMTIETAPGTILGSPSYMAPEMWRSDEVDTRTDIYQAGIVGYELIADAPPFAGTSHQLMFQHLHSFLPDLGPHILALHSTAPPDWINSLNELFKCATDKDPEQRYSSAAAFANEVRQAMSYFGPVPGPQELPTGADMLAIGPEVLMGTPAEVDAALADTITAQQLSSEEREEKSLPPTQPPASAFGARGAVLGLVGLLGLALLLWLGMSRTASIPARTGLSATTDAGAAPERAPQPAVRRHTPPKRRHRELPAPAKRPDTKAPTKRRSKRQRKPKARRQTPIIRRPGIGDTLMP